MADPWKLYKLVRCGWDAEISVNGKQTWIVGLHTREEFGGAMFQINDGNVLDRRIMTNNLLRISI